jgi:hypothetical protein
MENLCTAASPILVVLWIAAERHSSASAWACSAVSHTEEEAGSMSGCHQAGG